MLTPGSLGRFPRHFYRKSQASKTKPRHGLASPEPGLDAVRSKESLKDGSTSNFGISMRFMEIYGDLWRFMEIYGDLWRFMEIYGDLWRFMYGDLIINFGSRSEFDSSLLKPPAWKKNGWIGPTFELHTFCRAQDATIQMTSAVAMVVGSK